MDCFPVAAATLLASILIPWVSCTENYGLQESNYRRIGCRLLVRVSEDTPTNGAFRQCIGQGYNDLNYVLENQAFDKMPAQRIPYFGTSVRDYDMKYYTDVYRTNCGKYLADHQAKPEVDESDAMNDGKAEYPYKAFSYCFMNTLRKAHGDKAIEAVKSERTHSKKDIKQTLLDHTNEIRALHGAEPLKMMDELSVEAQKWADNDAQKCLVHNCAVTAYHKGEKAGKSHGATSTTMDNEGGRQASNFGYTVLNKWYDGRTRYSYKDAQVKDKDHPVLVFTQMIWKGTIHVGYGIAKNNGCRGMGRSADYVVAVYYPEGNINGKYKENVLPSKESKS